MKIRTMLSLCLAITSGASFADANISKEIECYKALIGSPATGANFILGENSILIPAQKGAKAGFYLFSKNDISFNAFPEQPIQQNSDYNYYYFALNLPGSGKSYLTYSKPKNANEGPGISERWEPVESWKGKEQKITRVSEISDSTRSVLQKELEKRLSTLHSNYAERLKYNDPRDRGDLEEVKSGLDKCEQVPKLEAAVKAQREKFGSLLDKDSVKSSEDKDKKSSEQ